MGKACSIVRKCGGKSSWETYGLMSVSVEMELEKLMGFSWLRIGSSSKLY